MSTRHFFHHDGMRLSYLDSGGPGPIILALHALWMEATSFEAVTRRLFPNWRVIALDQRGHGWSDHARDYSRAAFVGDIGALLDHLQIEDPVLLMGNSLGGTNAFQFAARYPSRVRAMIIEEAAAEEHGGFDFLQTWSGNFPGKLDLAQAVGDRLYWSVAASVRQTSDGYIFAFNAHDMIAVGEGLNGNWWDDWLASDCPALVIGGTDSRVVDHAVLQAMVQRRPDSDLTMIDAGHVVHEDNVAAFARTVTAFLQSID